MNTPANDPGTAALYFGVLFLVYFFPTLVTYFRGVYNRAPTFIVNLFLGWTVLGWIFALVMAASAKKKSDVEADRPARSAPGAAHRERMKTCPQCAEQIQFAAKICRFCRYDFKSATASEPAAH